MTYSRLVAELRGLGVNADQLQSLSPLHSDHGHALYRVTQDDGRSFVLKVFPGQDHAPEIRAYELLKSLSVPTIPVHGMTTNALLLEDLGAGTTWRLATEDDVALAYVGEAVARWYRTLHTAGSAYLDRADSIPASLTRETDDLTPAVVLEIGDRLDLGQSPVWALAATHLEPLVAALRGLPQTLTYNDFHWTNLAVSRNWPLRVAVVDYHLLGIGPAVGNYRNVLSVLTGDAADAFQAAYGPIDPRHLSLDAPLATLSALAEAVQRPRLPSWACQLRVDAASGKLEEQIYDAMAVL